MYYNIKKIGRIAVTYWAKLNKMCYLVTVLPLTCRIVSLIGIKSNRFTFSSSVRLYAHLHSRHRPGAGEYKTPMLVWLEQLEEELTELATLNQL